MHSKGELFIVQVTVLVVVSEFPNFSENLLVRWIVLGMERAILNYRIWQFGFHHFILCSATGDLAIDRTQVVEYSVVLWLLQGSEYIFVGVHRYGASLSANVSINGHVILEFSKVRRKIIPMPKSGTLQNLVELYFPL